MNVHKCGCVIRNGFFVDKLCELNWIEHFVIFYRKFRVFPVFSVFFVLFHFSVFSVCFETVCFSCFASILKQRVSIEPKQTEDPHKQFKREYIWEFFRKFRVVSVCFGLLRNRSVCFGCFDIGSKHRNKPNIFLFGFTKQTETNAKQILFRFVSVCFGSNRNLFLFVSRTPNLRPTMSVYAW